MANQSPVLVELFVELPCHSNNLADGGWGGHIVLDHAGSHPCCAEHDFGAGQQDL